MLLPVGISFYTFQTLSYTIDVYRGKKSPEKHFGYFALYVSFFPQLIAGPIERSTSLLPQLRKKIFFNYNQVKKYILLICWGFFKKIVVADNLGVIVDIFYNTPTQIENGGLLYLISTYFFAFQIYCDFSGYSDIAIGTAGILGYKLTKNFNRPYIAKSIRGFWQRWHISLSTWFKDYLYIPLGGNKVIHYKMYINLLITFIISGLWHGASWTFIIWGSIHGLIIVTSKLIYRKMSNTKYHLQTIFPNKIKIFITFHIVLFSWIFFRSINLTDAIFILNEIPKSIIFIINNISQINQGTNIFGLSELVSVWDIAFSFMLIFFLLTIEWLQNKIDIPSYILSKRYYWRWLIYFSIFFSILFLGRFQSKEFIYFQF